MTPSNQSLLNHRKADWLIGCCIVAMLGMAMMSFYVELTSRHRFSQQYQPQSLRLLLGLQHQNIHENQTSIRLPADQEDSLERLISVSAKGMVAASVELELADGHWLAMRPKQLNDWLHIFSTHRDFSLTTLPSQESTLRVTTWSYDGHSPIVSVLNPADQIYRTAWDNSLAVVLIVVPCLLLVILWMYAGIEENQLKIWTSLAILLSAVILATSLKQVIKLDIHSAGPPELIRILVAMVGLAATAFCQVIRAASHQANTRGALTIVTTLTAIGMLVLTFISSRIPSLALLATASFLVAGHLALVMCTEQEAFFSSRVLGLRFIAVFKLIATVVALACFFVPHPGWVDMLLPAIATTVSIFGLFLVQFDHRKMRDGLAIKYALRQRTLDSVRFSEAGIRLRETLRGYRHDLRQPLQSLTLMLGLEAHLTQNTSSSVRTQKMIAAQKSLTSMLDDFFGTMESELEGSDDSSQGLLALNDVIAPLVSEYGQVAGNKSLFVRYVPTRIRIKANAEPFKRLLRNIIDNAVKYTRTGGIIIGVRWQKRHWQLWVQDSGPGISSQGDKLQKGWGYGSLIMKKLAKRTGVRVMAQEIHSVAGSIMGTRIMIEIPRLDAVTETGRQKNQQIGFSSNRHVIILAHQDSDLSILSRHLGQLQVNYLVCSSITNVLRCIVRYGLSGGLICVCTEPWNTLLSHWDVQLQEQAGIPLPTLWLDQRQESNRLRFPLPVSANELEISDDSFAQTGFALADHFGIPVQPQRLTQGSQRPSPDDHPNPPSLSRNTSSKIIPWDKPSERNPRASDHDTGPHNSDHSNVALNRSSHQSKLDDGMAAQT